MSLIAAPSATCAQFLVSLTQPQAQAQTTAALPRPQLKMVWHKEFDGKRDRLVARWVVCEPLL